MRLLSRWFDLRAGEGRLLATVFFTLFGVVGAHTMLETARDALFLGKLPVSRLTFVYAALAGLTLLFARWNDRFVRRFGRRNALIFTLMTAANGTLAFWFLPLSPPLVFALYVWSGVIATVMVAQFWALSSQVFTVAQGKRLFGPIAAGGVLGAVSGATIAAGVLELMEVRALLVLAPLIFLAVAALLTALPSDELVTAQAPTTKVAASSSEPLWKLLKEPYVLRLTASTVVITAVVLIVDYLMKATAAHNYSGAELGRFIARYYALLNAVALAVQLFLSSRLIRRFGVIGAMTLLPVLLMSGGAAVLLTGGALFAVLLTKGADGALRHSLQRVASELTWLPLPDETRRRVKGLVDTSVVRGTQAVTAGLVFALAELELDGPRWLAAIVAGLSAIAVGLAVGLWPRYTDLFRRALEQKRSGDFRLDLNSVEVVIEALSSPEDDRVLAAIDLLVGQNRARLIPSLILYHQSPAVLVRAIPAVSDTDRRDSIPLLERLLTHASEEVRVAAVVALARRGLLGPIESRLEQESPTVQGYGAFALALREHPANPIENPRLRAILEQPGEEGVAARRALLEAIAKSGDRAFVPVIERLAAQNNDRQLEALAHAIEHVPVPELLPLLISKLDHRDERTAVRAAILACGAAGLDAVILALSDPSTRERVQLHLPRTISRFRNQRAFDVLVDVLTSSQKGAVRFKALRGLGRMAEEQPYRIDRRRFLEEVRRNLLEYFRLIGLVRALRSVTMSNLRAEASCHLLEALILEKGRQARSRVFRLLQILHRSENLRTVHDALEDGERTVRSAAVELVDNLTLDYPRFGPAGEAVRALLRVVTDDLSDEERIERVKEDLPPGYFPEGASEALERLLLDSDRTIATLAADVAWRIDDARLKSRVEEVARASRFMGALRLESST